MSGMKRMGRCLNNGRCDMADSALPIPLDFDAAFVCPDCRSELVPHLGKARKSSASETRMILKVLAIPVVALIVGLAINFI